MSKVNGIANTCAGVIGGGLAYLAHNIEQQQIQQAALSLIPALTLLTAHGFRLVGNMASLSFFSRLLHSKAVTALDELRLALDDPHLTDKAKQDLRDQYAEVYKIKLDSQKEDVDAVNKAKLKARSTLSENIQKDYQDNPELKKTLAEEQQASSQDNNKN